MKKHTKKLLALVLTLAMTLTLFAGCGSKNDAPAASAGETTAPTIPEQTTLPADTATAEKESLTIGFGWALDSMTPFRNNIGQDSPMFRQMYESLGILDYTQGKFVPWVAKSWNTEDGLNYDVEIYDYVEDAAGNKITADDIVWFIETSMERALKPQFSKIASVEKTGDYTLHITMTTDMVGAFDTIMVNTFVISKAAFEASADEFASKIVTTSPYEVTSFTPSSDIVMVKRDNYWQTNEELIPEHCKANVKNLTYKYISEASQQSAALQTGAVDAVVNMNTTVAVNFVNDPNYTTLLSEGPQGWTLFFSGHESRPVSNDVNLVKAIEYCIDTDAIITAWCNGYGTKMHDVCPDGALGYNPKWNSEEYFDYNPELAKEYLAKSNYNGQTLEILTSSANTMMPQMIQAYMAAIGINCELKTGDMAFISAIRLNGAEYDMFINTIGADYLASHWSIRYDMNAYSTGDGTSRHDETLTNMLYSTWTNAGYTEENIDAVHNYLMENGIARGLVNPQNFLVIRNDAGLVKQVIGQSGNLALSACEYAG